jgi:hypothetical protein
MSPQRSKGLFVNWLATAPDYFPSNHQQRPTQAIQEEVVHKG